MKKFAQGNEEKIFIKKESTEGTFVYPSSANAILAIGVGTNAQEDEFIPDAQVRNRRSRLSPIKGRTNTGIWSWNTYIKPSGTAGTAPETDVLWECGMGKKTENPGTSVVYSFDSSTNLPSFSILRKVGHMVYFIAGATVDKMDASVSGSAIASVAWGGEFMKQYYAGTTTLAAQCTVGAGTCVVVDAKRFSNSIVKITIGTDDNSGSGYLVTSIDYATNTISFTPTIGVTQALGLTVAGWYPSTSTEVGVPVHGKLGIVTIDGKSAVVLEARISLVNGIKYYVDTKNGQLYPTVYGAPGFRDVTGNLRCYFYKNIPQYFYRSSNQLQNALIVPAGNVSGKICEFSCPRIEYKSPALSGEEEVMADLGFTAAGSVASGDDELTVTFK